MRFTYNQLKKYLKTNLSPIEIANALTMLGLEIEEVIDKKSPLADFIVGEIVECSDHPDSDHLHLLKVNTGSEILDVVCGAPNARKGLKGILARPGNIIPADGSKLKKGMVRGKPSNGMMCSIRELDLGTEHDGIIELDDSVVAGQDAISALEKTHTLDVIYEGNVLPNHPDYLGIIGIARDLSAGGFGEFIAPDIKEVKCEFKSPINVINNATEDAKEFNTRYIKGVKNSESPKWLKDYLTSVDMNSISALVDITNFCLHNLNRPLHVFDADKIKGNLVLDYAKGGEEFVALDGNTYILNAGDIVIKDDNGIQSLAGVMGGLATSCTMDTKNVLLESAYFNPVRIRKTAKQLKIESDSKFRFERGIDPCCTVWGLDVATNLILDICGGKASEICKTGACCFKEYKIDFPVSYFKKRVGFDIDKKDMIDILSKLGLKVSDKGDVLEVIPPSYRGDIEGPHDITEELVRVYGFEKLPAVSVKSDGENLTVDIETIKKLQIPHILANRGLTEVYTWSFMSDKKEFDSNNPIRVINPIVSDLNVMRKSIIPNLLDGVKENLSRSIASSNLFEVGPVFYGDKPTEQHLYVSGVRQGLTAFKDWSNNPANADVYDVKNDVFTICRLFDIDPEKLRYETENLPTYLNPYKSASVIFANKVIGYFGEIHPLTLKKFGIKHTNVVCFEINVDELPLPKSKKSCAKKRLNISDLQPISRDFAFIFDMDIKAIDITKAVKKANGELISSVRIFDIYVGDKLESGKKSVAINVVIVPKEKTLSDDEIQEISNKIVENVASLGGELRDK
ncbi:MAG: phenylalanine--tRNA ligase subunit beta [Alphaproteobacteria bacterium]